MKTRKNTVRLLFGAQRSRRAQAPPLPPTMDRIAAFGKARAPRARVATLGVRKIRPVAAGRPALGVRANRAGKVALTGAGKAAPAAAGREAPQAGSSVKQAVAVVEARDQAGNVEVVLNAAQLHLDKAKRATARERYSNAAHFKFKFISF